MTDQEKIEILRNALTRIHKSNPSFSILIVAANALDETKPLKPQYTNVSTSTATNVKHTTGNLQNWSITNNHDSPIQINEKTIMPGETISGNPKPADIPFNLEAAKRGEKVQVIDQLTSDKWFDVGYIGETSKGDIVIEYLDGKPQLCSINLLRMAPKKMRKVWIQSYIIYDNVLCCSDPCDTPDKAIDEISEICSNFTLLGDPIEIQVPDTRF